MGKYNKLYTLEDDFTEICKDSKCISADGNILTDSQFVYIVIALSYTKMADRSPFLTYKEKYSKKILKMYDVGIRDGIFSLHDMNIIADPSSKKERYNYYMAFLIYV